MTTIRIQKSAPGPTHLCWGSFLGLTATGPKETPPPHDLLNHLAWGRPPWVGPRRHPDARSSSSASARSGTWACWSSRAGSCGRSWRRCATWAAGVGTAFQLLKCCVWVWLQKKRKELGLRGVSSFWFHLPRWHFSTTFLSHSRVSQNLATRPQV